MQFISLSEKVFWETTCNPNERENSNVGWCMVGVWKAPIGTTHMRCKHAIAAKIALCGHVIIRFRFVIDRGLMPPFGLGPGKPSTMMYRKLSHVAAGSYQTSDANIHSCVPVRPWVQYDAYVCMYVGRIGILSTRRTPPFARRGRTATTQKSSKRILFSSWKASLQLQHIVCKPIHGWLHIVSEMYDSLLKKIAKQIE